MGPVPLDAGMKNTKKIQCWKYLSDRKQTLGLNNSMHAQTRAARDAQF